MYHMMELGSMNHLKISKRCKHKKKMMWHVYFQNFKAHPAEDAAGMAFPAFSENPNLASTSSSLIFLKAPPPDGGLGEDAFFPGPDNSDLAGHVGNMPFKGKKIR